MDHNDFDSRFEDCIQAEAMARSYPDIHDAAKKVWNTALCDGALTIRMKELVLLAIFASPAGYNQPMVDMQIARSIQAGATHADIADVLISIAGIANHALYAALPLAEEVFSETEISESSDIATLTEVQQVKDDFVRIRGFWNPERDRLARMLPKYFLAAGAYSACTAKHGSLTPVEHELIYIAADASVNHMSQLGLRIHFKNAKKTGVTYKQVAAVLQIVGAVGFFSYIRSAKHLVG